ncbi:MAG: hypothetical protein AB1Z55_02245 [Acidimicrobiia bacterium]
MTAAATTTVVPSRGRLIATRVLAWLAAGLAALGAAMLASYLPAGAEAGHQLHDVAGLVLLVGVIGASLVRIGLRPAESDAAVQMLVGVTVINLVVALATGGFDPFHLVLVGVAVVVGAVSPSSLVPSGPKDRRLLGGALVALALVPYAIEQLRLQALAPAADPHAEFGHYGGMASMSFGIILLAYLASTKRSAWRLPGWMAGLAVVVLGVGSLAFVAVSRLSTTWAVVAIAAGVLWIGLVEWTARQDADTGATATVG